MRVGIFGGTFNPIHMGHRKAAECFFDSMHLDKLLVIPDRIPPHKQIAGVDRPEVRFHMTKLAFADFPSREKVEISDMELRRNQKSYTFDTLTELKKTGNDDYYLYCGTDMLLTFDTWYRFADILTMCTIAYGERENQDAVLKKQVNDKIAMLEQTYGAKIARIPLHPFPISSSEIRNKIRRGETVEAYLPPAVYAYIKENKIYE